MPPFTALAVAIRLPIWCSEGESSLAKFEIDLVSAQHSAALCRKNFVVDRMEFESVISDSTHAIAADKILALWLCHK